MTDKLFHDKYLYPTKVCERCRGLGLGVYDPKRNTVYSFACPECGARSGLYSAPPFTKTTQSGPGRRKYTLVEIDDMRRGLHSKHTAGLQTYNTDYVADKVERELQTAIFAEIEPEEIIKVGKQASARASANYQLKVTRYKAALKEFGKHKYEHHNLNGECAICGQYPNAWIHMDDGGDYDSP